MVYTAPVHEHLYTGVAPLQNLKMTKNIEELQLVHMNTHTELQSCPTASYLLHFPAVVLKSTNPLVWKKQILNHLAKLLNEKDFGNSSDRVPKWQSFSWGDGVALGLHSWLSLQGACSLP